MLLITQVCRGFFLHDCIPTWGLDAHQHLHFCTHKHRSCKFWHEQGCLVSTDEQKHYWIVCGRVDTGVTHLCKVHSKRQEPYGTKGKELAHRFWQGMIAAQVKCRRVGARTCPNTGLDTVIISSWLYLQPLLLILLQHGRQSLLSVSAWRVWVKPRMGISSLRNVHLSKTRDFLDFWFFRCSEDPLGLSSAEKSSGDRPCGRCWRGLLCRGDLTTQTGRKFPKEQLMSEYFRERLTSQTACGCVTLVTEWAISTGNIYSWQTIVTYSGLGLQSSSFVNTQTRELSITLCGLHRWDFTWSLLMVYALWTSP